MRIIPMKKVREVLRLHIAMKLSARKTSKATGVPRTTTGDYIRRFVASGLTIEDIDTISDKVLLSKLFPDGQQQSKPTKAMPDMAYIYNELKNKSRTKVTLQLLWEEYKADNPTGYEYTQFRVHYNRYKERLNPSMRQVHMGGEKLFVDYSGLTLPIYSTKTNESVKAQIFVAVLGASGYTFVHASSSQKQEDFILSHVKAYSFFGGTPKIVVPDNLKSAVISNNKNGIVINESYAELSRHYSMAIEPARPYKPRDKAKVEQGVQAIQRYILATFRHRKFYSIDELNDAISTLLDNYNNKVVKHLGKSRAEMYSELDLPYLTPLPANSYSYKQYKIARVNLDYHISLEKCNYSVPYEYLKEEVDVRYNSQTVQIYHSNILIAVHPRLFRPGDTSTLNEHMPSSHEIAKEKMNPARLLSWAGNIGEYSTMFVNEIFANAKHQVNGYRLIISVLSFAKLYGKLELELALMYALEKNTLRHKSIKSILDKKLYLAKSANNHNSPQAQSLFNTHANIRGSDEYK